MSLGSGYCSPKLRKNSSPLTNEWEEEICSSPRANRYLSAYHKDNNMPQIILERSSNSSNDEAEEKVQTMKHQSDREYAFFFRAKKDTGTESKNTSAIKSRSDYKIQTLNHIPDKSESESKVLFSSLGIPNLQISRKKTMLEEREAEEDCRLCRTGGWTRTKLMLTESRLAFFQFSVDLRDLQKIKILPYVNNLKTRPENIIKITTKKQAQLFSLSIHKRGYDVPTSYYIFAKLIENKLMESEGLGISSWEKQEHLDKKVMNDSYIYGNIFKKSQMLGNWQKRFVVIRKNGVFSYRNSSHNEKFSFFINAESIKQIWTRFEKIDGFLVIKVKHGFSKTEFGIPIIEFSTRSSINWLYFFYRILPVVGIGNDEK